MILGSTVSGAGFHPEIISLRLAGPGLGPPSPGRGGANRGEPSARKIFVCIKGSAALMRLKNEPGLPPGFGGRDGEPAA